MHLSLTYLIHTRRFKGRGRVRDLVDTSSPLPPPCPQHLGASALFLMGCANSKGGDDKAVTYGSGAEARTSHLKPDSDVEAFREKLFANVGTQASFAPGEVLIEEGKVSVARTALAQLIGRPSSLSHTAHAPRHTTRHHGAAHARRGFGEAPALSPRRSPRLSRPCVLRA